MSYLFSLDPQYERNQRDEANANNTSLMPEIGFFETGIGWVITFVIVGLIIRTIRKMKIHSLIFRKLKTPIQRTGLVLTLLGSTSFILSMIYDAMNLYHWTFVKFIDNAFSQSKRHYQFQYLIAFYSLIIASIGIWLAWVHELTTAKLLIWIKTGSFK
jgi:hypothetical protein